MTRCHFEIKLPAQGVSGRGSPANAPASYTINDCVGERLYRRIDAYELPRGAVRTPAFAPRRDPRPAARATSIARKHDARFRPRLSGLAGLSGEVKKIQG